MVVRAHAVSLERETLMQSYFIALQKGPLVEADPLSDEHRCYNNSPAFDEKRRSLIGRDLSVYRHDDLLAGILDEEVKESTVCPNLSQPECLNTHCRNVHHDINLILGPFGSGKTVLVSKLCELQKLRMPESDTFVAASSNSVYDAVVPKFATSD